MPRSAARASALIIAVFAVLPLASCEEEPAWQTPVSVAPPANAEFTFESPAGILAAMGASRGTAAEDFIGLWNSAEGWEGVVEAVTAVKGQETLRLQVLSSTIIGGGYSIFAITGPGHGAKAGDTVRVQGCITDIKTTAAAAMVTHKFTLSPARIVLNQGR